MSQTNELNILEVKVRDERGQALPLALVALAIGALLVPVFMQSVSVHTVAARNNSSSLVQQYSAEAGIEDAIWQLASGDLASELTFPGDTTGYTLSAPVNDIVPGILVTRVQESIAIDDLESGGWAGGSGWLYDWHHEGDSIITSADSPHEGTYHIQMRNTDSYIKRALDTSEWPGTHLILWAKVSAFESGDKVYCKISPDNFNWTTVMTWTSTVSDDTYHIANIDLSSYTMSSEFWIAFDSEMDSDTDYFYIDDVEIAGPIVYEIISTAGSEVTTADISVEDGNITIQSWTLDIVPD